MGASRHWQIFAAIVTIAAFAIPASGQTRIGDLLTACDAFEAGYQPAGNGEFHYNSNADSGICYGFFSAFFQFSYLRMLPENAMLMKFCPPPGVSLVQYIRIFTKYAREHPEIQHEAPTAPLMTAFMHAYPCP